MECLSVQGRTSVLRVDLCALAGLQSVVLLRSATVQGRLQNCGAIRLGMIALPLCSTCKCASDMKTADECNEGSVVCLGLGL